MVRRPFGCFWSQNGGIRWISPILAEFHQFWWILVKFCYVWCLGGGNLAFTRSTMKTQSILGLFRWFSRPDRYFSPISTHFRWFSVNSPEMVGNWGLGRKMLFLGEAGWGFHQFRIVITVVSAPGAKVSTFHPKTQKTRIYLNDRHFNIFHQIFSEGKRTWNLHVLQRVLQGPPGTGVNADFT